MCGGIRQHKVIVRPGQSVKYRTLAGERTGVWGLGNGTGAYNARSENLLSKWGSIKDNRAVVPVDSFEERGVDFRRRDPSLTTQTYLAAIYNDMGELVILTEPARDGIEQVHHRQPVVLRDPGSWLVDGTTSTVRVSSFERVPVSAEERRRTWLWASQAGIK